jgi:SecD/SecF fusion protein
LKKNLSRIILTLVFIALAVYFIYPTYQDYKLNQELGKLRGEDSLNFVDSNADQLRKAREDRIKLGLDLKGGMYVVLDVDVIKLLEDMANQKDETLIAVLAEVSGEASDEEVLDVLKRKLQERNITLKAYYGGVRDTEDDVESTLRSEIDNALDRAVEVVRNRVDQYGVAEPQIQKIGNSRIIVELPGVSDPEEVRELLQGTALLEFKLIYDPQQTVRVMEAINNVLVGKTDIDTTEELLSDTIISQIADTTATTVQSPSETDTNLVSTDTGLINDTSLLPEDQEQLSEEEFREKYPFFTLVSLDPQGETADGFVRESDRERVDRILKREDVIAKIPSDMQFAWSQRSFEGEGERIYTLHAVKKEPELTGKVVVNAAANIDPTTNTPIVTMAMNDEGSAAWSRITGSNINKRCAIVLDNVVYSAPVIRNKITGGNSQIEGMGSVQEARLLEIVLKAGALPAPVKIIEERSIGPSLGEDSIRAGIFSSLAALILVALFMVFYYRFGGTVADLALLINMLFILGIMASLKATLTLPGIAGLILSIGMSVDTNVLIFERIREELKTGKPLRTAIDIGYKKAFSAIIDSHLTSIITAIILYQFGSGPIQGFAITLLFGLVANLFTAIVVTHYIFDLLLEKKVKFSFG